MHGYGYGSFTTTECPTDSAAVQCGIFDNLLGSRMLVANIEVRAPLVGLFTGELEYGRVPSRSPPSSTRASPGRATRRPSFAGGTRNVVRSAGGAARINVFGLLILEVAASRPFDRLVRGWRWQVALRQGF